MEQNTLTDQLVDTQFGKEFVKILAPLTGKHLKIYLKNNSLKYEEIGDEYEKKLKEIGYYYGLLQTIVSDLELVLTFLKIEDRKQILEIFPSLESQKQYYKYHIENFIIRIVTITDVVGKLGNSIFETALPEEKCNGYTFKELIQHIEPNCGIIITKLLTLTKDIKDKRNCKLHTGETKIGYFEGIVFWDELSKIIKSDADPLLDKLTDDSINEEIVLLENDIRQIIKLVVEFTDFSTKKFTEIAARKTTANSVQAKAAGLQ
jgi:hypothetical protein